VADTTLSTLLQAYGAGVCTRRGVRTPSADDAGRWIAEAARAGLADVWRCVPGDSFTWVRLDGTGGIDDIIITETGLEASWQAAPTRH
jgi:hypothetical protein